MLTSYYIRRCTFPADRMTQMLLPDWNLELKTVCGNEAQPQTFVFYQVVQFQDFEIFEEEY